MSLCATAMPIPVLVLGSITSCQTVATRILQHNFTNHHKKAPHRGKPTGRKRTGILSITGQKLCYFPITIFFLALYYLEISVPLVLSMLNKTKTTATISRIPLDTPSRTFNSFSLNSRFSHYAAWQIVFATPPKCNFMAVGVEVG